MGTAPACPLAPGEIPSKSTRRVYRDHILLFFVGSRIVLTGKPGFRLGQISGRRSIGKGVHRSGAINRGCAVVEVPQLAVYWKERSANSPKAGTAMISAIGVFTVKSASVTDTTSLSPGGKAGNWGDYLRRVRQAALLLSQVRRHPTLGQSPLQRVK